MHATFLANPSLINLVTLILFGEQYIFYYAMQRIINRNNTRHILHRMYVILIHKNYTCTRSRIVLRQVTLSSGRKGFTLTATCCCPFLPPAPNPPPLVTQNQRASRLGVNQRALLFPCVCLCLPSMQYHTRPLNAGYSNPHMCGFWRHETLFPWVQSTFCGV